MNRIENLAKLLGNNWFFHDKKRYDQINKNTSIMLNKLGYEKMSSKKASKIIAEIFKLADKAEIYQKRGNEKKEREIYNTLKNMADDIDEILGREKNSKYEIMWWKTIRHKKYVLSTFYIFNDQMKKFKIKNIIPVFKSTYCLVKAGLAHDKNDWGEMNRNLIKYWKIIDNCRLNNFLEF